VKQRPPLKPGAAPSPTPYLLTSLFVSGACSLALEIVGTRLISPFYGSSLYTWSALITTTLLALAVGYAWGGRLADRTPHLTLFARLLLVAGLTVAATPFLRESILRASAPLGVRLGALLASAALVGPALALLGALGPVATRLTATGAADAGRRAGDAWAVSTAGSVLGAALTGFVLVPLWPVSRILLGIAAVLIALGAWGSRLAARRLPLAQLAACAACVFLAVRADAPPHALVRERLESAYGRIEVLETDARRRYLLVNGTAQSVMMTDTGLSDSDYDRSLEWLMALRPGRTRALALGLGAGLLPKSLENAGLTVDVVEIDPAIVDVARRWFGYAPKGRVTIGDARAVLEAGAERPWDFVILDVFGAESPPAHLFTEEAFAKMRSALAPGGVLAVNLVTVVDGRDGAAWRATLKTLARVFPNARAFRASETNHGLANVLLFASDGPLDAPTSAVAPSARAAAATMLAQELRPERAELDDAPIMTDDRAPLDSLLAPTALRWRELLQSELGEVLIR
jgi:spermidine synthase